MTLAYEDDCNTIPLQSYIAPLATPSETNNSFSSLWIALILVSGVNRELWRIETQKKRGAPGRHERERLERKKLLGIKEYTSQ